MAGSPLTRPSAAMRGARSSRTAQRRSLRALVIAVALVLACVAALLAGASAHAATTLTVNTLADNPAAAGECAGAPGDCSLRQALEKAQSGDTVIVPANAAPYVLEHEKIPIRGGVTVAGAGAAATTISGGGAHQAFDLLAGPLITIANLTIDRTRYQPSGSEPDQGGAINGEAKGGGAELLLDGVTISNSETASGFGGAVETNSSLTVRRSRFLNNSASIAAPKEGGGGAIDLLKGGSSLTISDSVFANNSARSGTGGAVLVENEDSLSVTSSTFNTNIAAGGAPGGAIELLKETTATIYNSTFTANAAGVGGAVSSEAKQLTLVGDTLSGNAAESGANLAALPGKASAENTIFAAATGGGASCSVKLTSAGHNLDDAATSSCGLSAATADLLGANPLLLPLSGNASQVPTAGGPPATLALAPGSPALGAGAPDGCAIVGLVDERGFPRPGIPGAGCDIGAFELLATVPSTTVIASSAAVSTLGAPVALTAAVVPARALSAAVPALGGSVEFRDGATPLGSAIVDAHGHAALSTSALALGGHTITAVYGGDLLHSGSSSAALAVSVVPPVPVISGLTELRRSWREGRRLAQLARARRTPVGTSFSFALNTPATVTLAFTRTLPGRTVRGRCVVPRRRNRRHRACVRSIAAGSITFSGGHAGASRISFEGRLSARARLLPGHYTLLLTARNVTGRAAARPISFTILR